jgi:very-short-patch-repair endonuclease
MGKPAISYCQVTSPRPAATPLHHGERKATGSIVPPIGPLSSGVTALQYVEKGKKEQARNLRKKSTPAENELWSRLRNRKLAGLKFRRQQVIEGFITDFYCEEVKLAIEVDGPVHGNDEQIKTDRLREKVFCSRGVYTLRFQNEAVLNCIQECLNTIIETARQRKGI